VASQGRSARYAAMMLCVLLEGCNAALAFRWGAPLAYVPAGTAGVTVVGAADAAAGVVLFGALAADGVRYYAIQPDGTRVPYYGTPESDPARRINVQDCTQPVDIQAGNLMCR
jgi:hypothetical protein